MFGKLNLKKSKKKNRGVATVLFLYGLRKVLLPYNKLLVGNTFVGNHLKNVNALVETAYVNGGGIEVANLSIVHHATSYVEYPNSADAAIVANG